MYQEKFMRRAIEISARALEVAGTEPFAAVVVREGEIVGEGINRAAMNLDPTSHGETEAIRDACRHLGTVDLRGCELYTSCEPCTLCVAAMQLAGIGRLYYAADLETSDAILGGLPDSARPASDATRLRRECGLPVARRAMPSKQALAAQAVEIIEAWAARARSAE